MRSTAILCRTRSWFTPRAALRPTSKRSQPRSPRSPRPSWSRSIPPGSRDCARCSRSRAGSSISRRSFWRSPLPSSSAIPFGSKSTIAAWRSRSRSSSAATDGFIRRPFLYLGLCYGLAGAIVALLVVELGLLLLGPPVRSVAALYGSSFSLSGLSLPESGILLPEELSSAGPAPGWPRPATCEPSSRSRRPVAGTGPLVSTLRTRVLKCPSEVQDS